MKVKRLHIILSLVLLVTCVISAYQVLSAQTRQSPDATKKDDPGEPVNYCIQCHRSLSGRPGSVVLEWEESVHAENNRECHICHGGDPTVNDSRRAKSKQFNFTGKPSKREVLTFCGREECHATAYRQLKRGPHYQSVLREGEPNCVSCHGEHNIQRSTLHIISDRTCADCHSVEYSREMVASISNIERNIEDIEESLSYLNSRHIETGEADERHSELKSYFHQMVHVFSQQEIDFTKKLVELEIEYLDNDLKSRITVAKRLDLIYLLTASVSILIIIAFTVYIALVTRRRNSAGDEQG